jgi:hypothetical protein
MSLSLCLVSQVPETHLDWQDRRVCRAGNPSHRLRQHLDDRRAQCAGRSCPSLSRCSSVRCALTDCSYPERHYRPPCLSALPRSEETVTGRCFLVSFVLRGQCWRYGRRYSITGSLLIWETVSPYTSVDHWLYLVSSKLSKHRLCPLPSIKFPSRQSTVTCSLWTRVKQNCREREPVPVQAR